MTVTLQGVDLAREMGWSRLWSRLTDAQKYRLRDLEATLHDLYMQREIELPDVWEFLVVEGVDYKCYACLDRGCEFCPKEGS